jgi:hypothetical protein
MQPVSDGTIRLRVPRDGDVESILRHAQHAEIEQTYWLPIRQGASREEATELFREFEPVGQAGDDTDRSWSSPARMRMT